MDDPDQNAPADATVEELAHLYEQHHRAASPIQRAANRITGALGRPVSLLLVFGLILAWMTGNYVARAFGSHALEEFPFPDLAFVATVTALLVALLILTTQRHEDELAEKRARLTLQIAVISEKKIAKVIALLEEQRRENPLLPSRRDAEAEAMASAADPRETLERMDRATPPV